MPGILKEEQLEGGEGCNKLQEDLKDLRLEDGSGREGVVSISPSPVEENGKATSYSSTSDSEANLNVSSASEMDGEKVTSPEGQHGESGASDEEDEGAGEGSVAKKKEGEKKKEKQTLLDSVVFNIRLSLPGVPKLVDCVMTSRDTVHDLLQYALERPECCYRTALSVKYKGKRVDDFFEIGSIEGLKDNDVMDIVEDSYTLRDIRLHVQRLKELLSSNPLQQGILSSEGLSLSFLSVITFLDPEGGGGASRVGDEVSKLEPPVYIIPQVSSSAPSSPVSCDKSSLDTPLSVFYPPNLGKHFKFPECLKSLSYSSWNPPPSRRKMKGDLLYLDMTTLEGQEYFVTATPSGFYLNKSSSRENFDPSPRKTSHVYKHLVGLLSQVSPLFKKNFTQLQKFGENLHAFEILPVPYPLTPWVAPRPEHKPVNIRIDDTMSLRPLPDELVLGQMRDWNEELQTAREFSTDSSSAKTFRDRALFKIHSDFVQASTRGAMAVVDGYLPSLNPGDEPKFRMYMWNNIFFSLAFDGRDHYKDFGGDAAAHSAAAADLHGVAAFEKLEVKELYMLGTVLVDYRGYRVVCQTIIPGLLQREHESAVVYGSIDTWKSIGTEEKFVSMLEKVGEELHIRKHKLTTEKGEVVTLPSSMEVKGIIGNDRRYYALDLFRIFPPDANFMGLAEGSKYRHKMATLRPEFLDTFLSFKFMLFLKLIKEKVGKVKQNQKQETEAPSGSNATPSLNSSDTTNNDTADTSDTSNTPDAAKCPYKAKPTDTANTSDSTNTVDTDTVTNGGPSETPEAEDGPSETPEAEDARTATSQNSAVSHEVKKSLPKAVVSLARTMPPTMSGISILSSSPSGGTTSATPQPLTSVKEKEARTQGELYLLDAQVLAEEKEVGSDIPCGLAEEDLSSAISGDTEPLTEPLKGTELDDQPEVTSAFKEALDEAGSTSMEEFVIRFNVDIFSPHINHADEESVLKRDEKLVRDASGFLVETVVPRFVRDCIQLVVTPRDGEGLTAAMHARGINMRYLGQVANLASLREDLSHIKHLCLSEMVLRLSKRRLRQVLQETPTEMTSEAIHHYLNCLLSEVDSSKEEPSLANGHAKKKKNKKKGARQKVAYLKMTTENLWNEIVEEMEWYYKFNMKYSSMSEMCAETGMKKLSLLREICRKTGIQILLRDYNFSVHPVFTEEDIIAVYPLVKHTEFRPAEPTAIYEMALSKLSSGHLQLAHELFVNALQMFVQVYGPMHLDTANCYRHMARIDYLMNNIGNALNSQHKATLILERVLGVDHPETVSAYINLALYCHASNQSASALKLLYRARYLLLLLFGDDHPEVATCDSNIAIILHSIGDYKNSHTFLLSTLKIHNKYYGTESLQVALTHHLLARVQSFLGDFRAALAHEKITFSIYNKKLGESHERTKESSVCLKELTGKAVTMQKTINEMTGKTSGGKLLVDLPGSWGEVVGMVNGVETKQQILKPKSHVIKKKSRRVKQPPLSPSASSQAPI